jgi:hypothetical protein
MDSEDTVTVGEVIRDLPKLRSRLSKGDSTDGWFEAVEQQKQNVINVLARAEDLQDVRDNLIETQVLFDAPPASTRKPDGRVHIRYPNWYRDERGGRLMEQEVLSQYEEERRLRWQTRLACPSAGKGATAPRF